MSTSKSATQTRTTRQTAGMVLIGSVAAVVMASWAALLLWLSAEAVMAITRWL